MSDGQHLLFVWKPSGYELVEQDGDAPMVGAEVKVGSRASGVVQRLFVRVGDTVLVSPFQQRGTLLTEPEGGKVQVQVGAMRMTVPYENLRRVVEARPVAVGSSALSRCVASFRNDASVPTTSATTPSGPVDLARRRAPKSAPRFVRPCNGANG